ncbi:cytochrome P450 [Sphingobium sp. B1D7B]|uniref:cytochrome P450 n=1 Tax=Sphingobium sp. B1D7B TaxID=2940578 RepID=UPI002223F435|nr:cytochrome P450 [Sphingobium sp. B1D7B]MCW2406913.1 cytochrome P450 [Sphingobium sp. B1D7B]
MATIAPAGPQSEIDLYSDEVLLDPFATYGQLRDLGGAVYLPKVDAWFVGRYGDVRSALNNWKLFSSDKGIGLNAVINKAWNEALICQDPPVHTERRRLINEALGPRSLKTVEDTVRARAGDLVDRLLAKGEFDGVADFAHDLPINVVMDLIGWPLDIRPRLLKFADGSWNAAGPVGTRMESGLGQLEQMMGLIAEIYDENRLVPGGFAAQLVDAAHAGLITRETAIGMLAGYVVAAFETTISAMASGLWLFAQNPSEWDKLRSNPGLAMQAANEIVRIESPIQNFARFVTDDAVMGDRTIIPANSWAIVSYGSANRDEWQFSEPDRFCIDRKERQNLGFGFGPHGCAGQGLARMELTAVFTALAERVERISLTGVPVRSLNNVTRAFERLPVRFTPAR